MHTSLPSILLWCAELVNQQDLVVRLTDHNKSRSRRFLHTHHKFMTIVLSARESSLIRGQLQMTMQISCVAWQRGVPPRAQQSYATTPTMGSQVQRCITAAGRVHHRRQLVPHPKRPLLRRLTRRKSKQSNITTADCPPCKFR